MPPPPSASLARAPSAALDRPEFLSASVSILPELMERPVDRYLHKYDLHFKRVVPDWDLQYKTLEQQYLYKGDFAVTVREITSEGAIVQDVVTGIFGFTPESRFGSAEVVPGAVIHGVKCTAVDNTVMESLDVSISRSQTGILFEWDDREGHGYILPTETQEAYQMIRVLRRDIRWHGARRLTPGQFLQFDTALPDEVPIEANDERGARFALRVRAPKVRFSFDEAYAPPEPTYGDRDMGGEQAYGWSAVKAIQRLPGRKAGAMIPNSGRPERQIKTRAHPLLERFVDEAPVKARAESPAWLWQATMEYRYDDEIEEKIVPLQPGKPVLRKKNIRIMAHEVAHERGDTWQEPQMWQNRKDIAKLAPIRRKQAESMSIFADRKRKMAEKKRYFFFKKRLAQRQHLR